MCGNARDTKPPSRERQRRALAFLPERLYGFIPFRSNQAHRRPFDTVAEHTFRRARSITRHPALIRTLDVGQTVPIVSFGSPTTSSAAPVLDILGRARSVASQTRKRWTGPRSSV